MPSLSGASTVLVSTLVLDCNCKTGLQLIQRSGCRAANLSFAAARHFCSAKSLRGDCRGWGPRRSREMHRPRKEISRGNLLCAKSGLPSLSYSRRLSAQKYVTLPDWEKSLYRAAPGVPEGPRSLCFGKSPEEPLPRGSFGQLLRGGSTPRFFSQIRSVGSKPPGWQGTASQPPVLGPRVQPKSPPLRAGSKKPVFSS